MCKEQHLPDHLQYQNVLIFFSSCAYFWHFRCYFKKPLPFSLVKCLVQYRHACHGLNMQRHPLWPCPSSPVCMMQWLAWGFFYDLYICITATEPHSRDYHLQYNIETCLISPPSLLLSLSSTHISLIASGNTEYSWGLPLFFFLCIKLYRLHHLLSTVKVEYSHVCIYNVHSLQCCR